MFLFCLLFSVAGFAVVQGVYAADEYGLEATAKTGGLEGTGKNLPGYIGKVVGAVLFLIGGIFLILMIYGGVMWMTAAGNDERVRKARMVLGAAVAGTIVVFSAYALTNYIFDVLTKSPVA